MSKRDEPIPENQLFRSLLLRLLETQQVISPLARNTTNRALQACHLQNAYILSEIQSWLLDQTEDSAPSHSFSAAQIAAGLAGLESALGQMVLEVKTPGASDLTVSLKLVASTVPPSTPRRTTSQARSSRRAANTPQDLPRNSLGQVVFQSQS